MSEPILFHFDFISPYAYLAWTQIHAVAERHGRQVTPVPTLFAALLDHSGSKGPAEIPSKRVYIFKDVLRTARVLGVPLIPPPRHPFNPLLALRVASIELPAAQKRSLIDALFRGAWTGGGGVDSAEAVVRLLDEAGLAGAELVAAATTPEIKERLRAQTDSALAAGVFGVPTMRVDGELFWGYDSFGHLERFLRGDNPLSADAAELIDRWLTLPAGAQRRGI